VFWSLETFLKIEDVELMCNADQGQGDAWSPRLDLRERAIKAARAQAGPGARAETESSRPLDGTWPRRHAHAKQGAK